MKKLFTLLFMFIAIGAMQAQTVPDTIDLGGNPVFRIGTP